MAQYGLSPKSVLQGIPEWRVLQSNFHIIIERCSQVDCNHASYADLLETARILNVRTRTNKKRLTVRQLQNKLKQTLHQQSRKKTVQSWSGFPVKRSYKEMETELQAKGMTTLVYKNGKRQRLSKLEIHSLL